VAEQNAARWPLLVVLAAAAAIVLTAGQLPVRVASHFGVDGVPDGFMARSTYRILMAALAVGLPALVIGGCRAAIRGAAGSLRIPNRDYWLAPERREATVAYLVGHTAWLGAGIALFMLALHLLLLYVNSLEPPHLGTELAAGLMLGPLAAVLIWTGALQRHFRRP
jgi:uncharacterized membrane protein